MQLITLKILGNHQHSIQPIYRKGHWHIRWQMLPTLTYKGPSLTLSVYGDLAHRQFSDLDLSIHADDVVIDCRDLIELGYERTIPMLSNIKKGFYSHRLSSSVRECR